MTRSKNVKTPPLSEETQALEQLLIGDDNRIKFDFNGVDWGTFGSVVAGYTGMGAFVTVWVNNSNDRFCLSIRAGNGKRAYDFDDADQLNQWLPILEKQLSGLHKALDKQPQNGTVVASKARKGGDAK